MKTIKHVTLLIAALFFSSVAYAGGFGPWSTHPASNGQVKLELRYKDNNNGYLNIQWRVTNLTGNKLTLGVDDKKYMFHNGQSYRSSGESHTVRGHESYKFISDSVPRLGQLTGAYTSAIVRDY